MSVSKCSLVKHVDLSLLPTSQRVSEPNSPIVGDGQLDTTNIKSPPRSLLGSLQSRSHNTPPREMSETLRQLLTVKIPHRRSHSHSQSPLLSRATFTPPAPAQFNYSSFSRSLPHGKPIQAFPKASLSAANSPVFGSIQHQMGAFSEKSDQKPAHHTPSPSHSPARRPLMSLSLGLSGSNTPTGTLSGSRSPVIGIPLRKPNLSLLSLAAGSDDETSVPPSPKELPMILMGLSDDDPRREVFARMHGSELVLPPVRTSAGLTYSCFIDIPTAFEDDENGQKMVTAKERCYVFKPSDGAPGCEYAPRHKTKIECSKRGVPPYQQSCREVIAFALGHNIAGIQIVPPTAYVALKHKSSRDKETGRIDGFIHGDSITDLVTKHGSLQAFIHKAQTLTDLSSSEAEKVMAAMTLENFQPLSILDIVFCNTDRHLGNLMVTEEGFVFAIDHGLILPRGFIDRAQYVWMELKQAHIRFNEPSKAYIRGLDIDKFSTHILKAFPKIDKEAIETFRLSALLLKKGDEANLTPFQIASFLICPTISWGAEGYGLGVIGDPVMSVFYEKAKKITENANDFEKVMEFFIDCAIEELSSFLKEGPAPDKVQPFLYKFATQLQVESPTATPFKTAESGGFYISPFSL